MENYNTIINALRKNIATIIFIKKNGDKRIMKATLKKELTPIIRGTGTQKPNFDIVKCYDIEAEGWRSFRVNSVIKISI